jgi:hypothetical protein
VVDPDQLMRGLELLEVSRDDIEGVRSGACVADAERALAALKDRTRIRAHQLARELHPDLHGGGSEADLRAVLIAAAWVRDLEVPRYLYGREGIAVRVRRVDMGVRVEASYAARAAGSDS